MKATPRQWTAWLCITAIAIACLFMHFILRWGLPVGTDVSHQIQYVAANEALWKLGWLSWNLAALSLLCLCGMLYSYSDRGFLPTTGIICVAIGVIPDLTAEYHLSFGLYELASTGLTAEFVALQEHAMQLTGVYANGLYNIGGLILTGSLLATSRLSSGVAVVGVSSWLIGLSLSFFTLVGNFKASELATAVSMGLNLAFMALVTLRLFGRQSYT